MRASIHSADDCRDFPYEEIMNVKVFLDDVEQEMCTIADEEGGYVQRYEDWTGEQETVRGVVRIIGLQVDSRRWTGRY